MQATCSIDGCDQPSLARSWCGTHYARWRKHGDPLTVKHIKGDDERRFWSYVDTSGGPDACHPWTGAKDMGGYGRFGTSEQREIHAHRWLLGYLRGRPLEPDEMGCHHCDNRACCNLRHLYVGDASTNMRDKIKRGRHHEAQIIHCPRGHEYDEVNTRLNTDGSRACRACHREWQRKFRARRKREVRNSTR